MNGDIFCNGHSTLPNHSIHCNNKSSEEIAIIDSKSQTQGECLGRRHVILSPESSGRITEEEEEREPWPSNRLPLFQPYPALEKTKDTYSAHLLCQKGGQTTRRKFKAKKSSLRNEERKNSTNRKVTDYFPVRRSSRKSKSELECEEKRHIDELILKGIENGMMVQHIEGKGRGVFATQSFQKGQYVVEYHGDLLQMIDAKKREAQYALDPATGCYMYYFQYLSKTYCVDATSETGRMGRLINHSRNGNCHTKLHDINGIPHLILVASRDIDKGEELLYDYGDRRSSSIAAHPWLKH